MFREMRRRNQLLSEAETIRILESGSTGVLGVCGDDGYPYTVPLNYVYANEKIYFHCAYDGHKTDSIKLNDKVSFCVIEDEAVVPELLATSYSSVIVFGRAKILQREDLEAKKKILWVIADKYAKKYPETAEKEIESDTARTCIVEITIEHMTGKEAKKSVRQHQFGAHQSGVTEK